MRKVGQRLEKLALSHLRRSGLELVERNFSCRGGEVDLIMRDHEQIVFIEVRGRSASQYGGAADSVTERKQRRVSLAAGAWLSSHPEHGHAPCRFDVVALDGDLSSPKVEWIRGAFEAA